MSTIRVSVIVPVYNEEALLGECLRALLRQDDPAFEIIVVDNACTDRSVEIAAALGVRVVYEPHKGYVHALRAGMAAAQGEILACIDADTIAPAYWLSRLVARLTETPDTVAVGGTFTFHDGPRWQRLIGRLVAPLNYGLAGANMAVWRWAYWRVGGFDPTVNLGADRHLDRRLRAIGHVVIDPHIRVATSLRRLQVAPWSSALRYALNDLSLALRGRPLFFSFADVRDVAAGAAHRRVLHVLSLLVVLCLFLLNVEGPGAQVFGPVLAHTSPNQPLVALTFDDGPSEYTSEVLDILARYRVPATFFLVGHEVERYPDVARRIVTEGHAIGNHTYSHPLWAAMETPSHVAYQLDRGAQAIAAVTGVTPVLFRSPHGWRSPWMIGLARARGYQVVTWSTSPADWRSPAPQVIAQRVVNGVKPGAIVLLHDGLDGLLHPPVRHTVDALTPMIETLLAKGYRFVTVPELLDLSAPQTVPGATAWQPSARQVSAGVQ